MIYGWCGFWGLIQISRSLKVVMPWIFSRCQERWRRMERDMDGGRANDIFFHGYPVVPGLMVLSLIHFCCVFHPRFLYAFRWCSQFTGHCFISKVAGPPTRYMQSSRWPSSPTVCCICWNRRTFGRPGYMCWAWSWHATFQSHLCHRRRRTRSRVLQYAAGVNWEMFFWLPLCYT